MTDDAIKAVEARVRRADARVQKHEDDRRELAEALAEARRLGVRPRDLQEWTHYDRNHVGRILKAAGLTDSRDRP